MAEDEKKIKKKMKKSSSIPSYALTANAKASRLHQSTAASTWWRGPRPHLGWVEIPEGPSYPGHSPLFFRYAVP